MTSKRSFIKTMKEDLKRRIWPIALSLIGFFFALPVLALIKLEDHIDSLNQGWDNLISLQNSFVEYTLGPSNGFVIAGLMIMAVLNALHGMKYLHSRQEADFYGSIPVLRTTKFNAAFVNGILIAVVPYTVMYFLAAVIGASRGFVTGAGFLFAFETMLLEIAGFLLIYATIVLAAVLTGHTAVAAAGGAVLSFVLLSYSVLIDGYESMFFITRYDRAIDNSLYLSPFTLFAKILSTETTETYSTVSQAGLGYHTSNAVMALVCILITVILYAISLKLLKIRPAEAAGRAMVFEKTKPVIKVIIMIPVAMTFGAFFTSLTNSNSTYGWLIFGVIVGLILAHAAIEIIFEFDFKACLKHIPSGLIGAAVSVVIVSFFVFDFAGYDTNLPDKGRIDSAAVYIPGIENSSYSRSYYSDSYYSYNISDSDIVMESMMLGDIDDVYLLAQAGCDYARKYRWRGSAPKENQSSDTGPRYTQIFITLRKASGKAFVRSYYIDISDSEMFATLGRIYDTKEYKASTYNILANRDKISEGNVDFIRYESEASTDVVSSLTDSDIEKLLDTMAKETESLTLDYLKEEAPIGYIELEMQRDNPEAGVNSMYYSNYAYSNTSRPVGYVYPSFKETLSLLNQYGIDAREHTVPEDINYIIKLIYDADGNDLSERIESRDEIANLLPDLVNQDYSSVNFAVLEVNNDITYEVHFKKNADDNEYDASRIEYCVLKK